MTADETPVVPRDVWEEAFFRIASAITRLKIGEKDQDMLVASVNGASFAARAAYANHEDYFAGLGALDTDRVARFMEVFTLAEISRFVRHLADLGAGIDPEDVWEHLARSVLQAFGTSEASLTEARLIDAQFNHGMSTKGEQSSLAWGTEQRLLLSLAARALGAPFTLPQSLEDAEATADATGTWFDAPPGLNLTDLRQMLTVHDSLLASEAAMYEAYNSLRASRAKTATERPSPWARVRTWARRSGG